MNNIVLDNEIDNNHLSMEKHIELEQNRYLKEFCVDKKDKKQDAFLNEILEYKK